MIWITGASSGIGEALTRELSKQGALLIISARNKEKLALLNNSLPKDPGSAKVLDFDLQDLDKLNQKAEMALSFYGRIDHFISNAGMAIRDHALSTTIEVDKKLMDINYFAPMSITKYILPSMIQNKSGRLVIISSLSGKYGVPRVAAYAASKHALHGFFETLRSEIVDTGVDITMIIPGIIRTEITAHALKGDGTSFGKVETTFKNAYPVDKAAKKILKAIKNKKEESFVGGTERITLWLNRISPWLLRRFIRNHPIKRLRKLKELFSLPN